jgi:hypothetical protein
MVIEFISLLLTMTALQINSLTRNKIFYCPELSFFKRMTGALAPFSYLIVNCNDNDNNCNQCIN